MRQRFHKILIEQQLVEKGDRVLVGISGGPDSVALLALLRAVASEFPLTVVAAHLDHGMRAESRKDCGFVEDLCRKWDIPLVTQKEDIPAIARRRKLGLEETAREVRRDFLESTAREWNCSIIALGHNRGDQAETLVHRLVRGVGPAGLAAMRFKEDMIIRPLLGFSREEIIAYLDEGGIEYRTDQSNFDTRFTRNRIRHDVLPLLETFNPQLEKQLLQLSQLAAEDEDYWRETVAAALPTLLTKVQTAEDEGLVLDVEKLRKFPPALRKRVLRHCLAMVRGDMAGLSHVQVEAVDDLLFSSSPHAEADIKGCWVGRNYGSLCLKSRRPAPAAGYRFQVPGPGPLNIPGLGCFQAHFVDRPQGEDRWSAEFDAGCVQFPLEVRSFQAGDVFQPSGMAGRKKLKDLFIDMKIDRSWRSRIPLVTTANGQIIWLIGVRRAELFRPSAQEKQVLRLTFRPENDDTFVRGL